MSVGNSTEKEQIDHKLDYYQNKIDEQMETAKKISDKISFGFKETTEEKKARQERMKARKIQKNQGIFQRIGSFFNGYLNGLINFFAGQ